MTMEYYGYKPLDLDKDAIRLIRLFKGDYTDEVECEIFETFLHEVKGVPYDALSYTWGSKERSSNFTLNGRLSRVTSNLYTALRYLRSNDRDRILWVDAICIDQDNDKERGHQVGQMRLIYQYADQVLFWLGHSNKDIDRFMDLANHLQARAMARRNTRESWIAMWEIFVAQLGGIHTDLYKRHIGALEDLLKRPWFQGIWILQEVASARRAAVVCGWKSVSAQTFALLPSLMELKPSERIQAVLDIMPGHIRKDSWWSRRPNLYMLLRKFVTCEATDLRDRIYALLGIASDTHESGIFLPDYGMTVQQVIQRTISFLLFQEVLDNSIYKFPDWSMDALIYNIQKPVQLAQEIFLWALNNSNERLAIRLLQQKEFDVNKDGTRGNTPLLILAERGCHDMVLQSLLARDDVDVNIQDNENLDTALVIATQNGHKRAVEALVGHENTNLNSRGSSANAMTPLLLATSKGQVDLVKLFLDKGANIEAKDIYGCTPLWISASNGHQGIVSLLLEKGADIKSEDHLGYNPIWISASNGHQQIVKMLLEKGAQLGIGDYGSMPPVPAHNWQEVVGKLLRQAASLGIREVAHNRSLLFSATLYKLSDIANLLIEMGADVDIKDAKGRSALSIAAENDRSSIIAVLLNWGASIELRDNNRRTPLSLAAMNCNLSALISLLDGGADKESKDCHGRTPLSLAVMNPHSYPTVEALLNKQADMESKDNDGLTPLYLAVKTDSYGAVELLLQHGADTECRDRDGRTPLSIAAMRFYPALYELLLNSGADKEAQRSWMAEHRSL